MALPKKFNQIDKRVESLNDLNFYKISYEYEFTDTYKKALKEGYETSNMDLDKLRQEINGTKEFSALDDGKANEKINEWLQQFVNDGVLSDFEVTDIKSQSFKDKLDDKKLSPLFEGLE